MIISRSPLRISLGGGGTDLPSYYKKRGGFVISAAINKYVYTTIIKPFKKGIYLKYSSHEKRRKIDQIKHPIIKEVLKDYKKFSKQIEITTLADIPSGTGLGSSGSFTTSLIKGMNAFSLKNINTRELALKACTIEIDKLKAPVGMQDQFISAYGGIKKFILNKNGEIQVCELKISDNSLENLKENLLLFFTGFTRQSYKVLQSQKKKSDQNNLRMIKNLDEVKKIGKMFSNLLENNDLNEYGKLMNYHWKIKQERSKDMSNSRINYLYEEGLKNGAIGGKLVGAGGGGFLMFYCKDKNRLIKKMNNFGLEELNFDFDLKGTKLI